MTTAAARPVAALLDDARALLRVHQWAAAEAVCRQVLRAEPANAAAFHLLGVASHEAGGHAIAEALIRKAIQLEPGAAAFELTLGSVLLAQQRTDEALAATERALELRPGSARGHLQAGVLHYLRGDLEQATSSLHRALEIKPDFARAHAQLAVVLYQLNRWPDALVSGHYAVALDPNDAVAHIANGSVFLAQGEWAEAIASFRRAVEADPRSAQAHSNLLFARHFDPSCGRAQLLADAKEWARRHGRLGARPAAHANDRAPDRRLRIGYVSADLARHPVGYFLEAVLKAHDRAQVEVFCYSNGRRFDALSATLRAASDGWRWITYLGDPAAAGAIRQDGIDILVDLAGHTGYNRLELFARKPAPVQVSWLGYFDTTGLPAIDYLLADSQLCPEGDDEWYTERVVRLAGPYVCYAPPGPVAIGPLPAIGRGFVTFGCFNKLAKLNDPLVALWAKVLTRLPLARLVLRDRAFAVPSVRSRWLRAFADAGVAPARVSLFGQVAYADYLASYNEIDLALDPFPFNGGTTTVEALWMGVPVVTLAGDRFVSRMGASHLTAVGLPELIARTPEEYVDRAVALAADLPRLAALRYDLRQRLLISPLCDSRHFTRGLEAAYRTFWRAWCDAQPA